MVSAFNNSYSGGLGLPLTEEELRGLNEWRLGKGHTVPLTESPGLEFLQYGKNDEGNYMK